MAKELKVMDFGEEDLASIFEVDKDAPKEVNPEPTPQLEAEQVEIKKEPVTEPEDTLGAELNAILEEDEDKNEMVIKETPSEDSVNEFLSLVKVANRMKRSGANWDSIEGKEYFYHKVVKRLNELKQDPKVKAKLTEFRELRQSMKEETQTKIVEEPSPEVKEVTNEVKEIIAEEPKNLTKAQIAINKIEDNQKPKVATREDFEKNIEAYVQLKKLINSMIIDFGFRSDDPALIRIKTSKKNLAEGINRVRPTLEITKDDLQRLIEEISPRVNFSSQEVGLDG